MITLITGTPGAGKTAWTVQELTRLPSQRKVYVHGVPELKIAHEPIYCLSDYCEHCRTFLEMVPDLEHPGQQDVRVIGKPDEPVNLVEEWHEWATPGSLIVIDEVQRVWRPTNSSSKLPEDIAKLETHRHHGLDFWLISQGPHLFHSNVRLLVGKHIHLVDKWNGRSEYEWPECRQNVTSRSDAVVRPYTLPKKIFHLYKSSSLHVKQTHRKPLAFYGIFSCLFLLVIAGFFTYKRVNAHFEEQTASITHVQPKTSPVINSPSQIQTVSKDKEILIPPPPISSLPDFKPASFNTPESAPAYASFNEVKSVPHLIGCVKTPRTGCKCYSKQAAPYPTSLAFCESYLAGEYFNPYKEPKQLKEDKS